MAVILLLPDLSCPWRTLSRLRLPILPRISRADAFCCPPLISSARLPREDGSKGPVGNLQPCPLPQHPPEGSSHRLRTPPLQVGAAQQLHQGAPHRPGEQRAVPPPSLSRSGEKAGGRRRGDGWRRGGVFTRVTRGNGRPPEREGEGEGRDRQRGGSAQHA